MTSVSVLVRAAAGIALVGLLAAGSAPAADPVFPPGSHIGLVPPGAMKPSAVFRGFEDSDAEASILILEIPPQAYANVEKEMSAAAFEKQGLTEENRETLPLKSGKGLLVVGQQEIDGKKRRKWFFLASAPDATALIAVQVPDAAKERYPDAAMRTALTSLTVRPVVPLEEQLGLVPIVFDELSGLRPVRVVGTNGVLLTEGPKDTPQTVEQPLFLVSVALGGPEQASDRVNFARNLFNGLADFKDIRIVGNDILRLANRPTYEIQAEAKDAKTNTPMKLVQWVRFGNGAFLRFLGVARADTWAQAFPKFRAVRDGTRPRR